MALLGGLVRHVYSVRCYVGSTWNFKACKQVPSFHHWNATSSLQTPFILKPFKGTPDSELQRHLSAALLRLPVTTVCTNAREAVFIMDTFLFQK